MSQTDVATLKLRYNLHIGDPTEFTHRRQLFPVDAFRRLRLHSTARPTAQHSTATAQHSTAKNGGMAVT